MRKSAFVAGTICACCIFMASFAEAASPMESGQDVIVEAEGQGETKILALKNAWAEAVRLGIGMYLTAKTAVIDDMVTEEIVTHSRGRVNAYEELSSDKGASGWTVRIRARIEKDILQETAIAVQSKSVKVTSDDLVEVKNAAAAATTEEQKKASAVELIEALSLPTKLEDYLTFNFAKGNENGQLVVNVTISVNMDVYKKEILQKLCTILDQVAISKTVKHFNEKEIHGNMLAEKLTPREKIRPGSKFNSDCGFRKVFVKSDECGVVIDKTKYAIYRLDKKVIDKLHNIFTNISKAEFIYILAETLSSDESLFVNRKFIGIARGNIATAYSGVRISPVIYSGWAGQNIQLQIPLTIPSDSIDKLTDIKVALAALSYEQYLEVK